MNNAVHCPDQAGTHLFEKREMSASELMFAPSAEAIVGSQLTLFTKHLAIDGKVSFLDHESLHTFSTQNFRKFWGTFLEWSGLPWSGSAEPVCVGDQCETARFFPGVCLNYVESLLASPGLHADDRTAITSFHADGTWIRVTRGELRRNVQSLAAALLELGMVPEDRVAIIGRNSLDTIIATLAVAAIGASVATAQPEMGVDTLISRLQQISPRWLFAHVAPRSHDTGTPVGVRVSQIAAALSSIERVITLDDGCLPTDLGCKTHRLTELSAQGSGRSFAWRRFAFDHELFIMFSSGTTGRPKCIMHGAGGTLLEHVKEHRLHCDLRVGDKLLFQTACAWMMWHWQLSALASGAEIILYDGPVTHPRILWDIVASERVTVFGTSPAYLGMCQNANIKPGLEYDLGALRTILSTGSTLYDRHFYWVHDQVKQLALQSISGGTDIIGCFVLGNPNLPVYIGKCQCRSLGLDVQAMTADGLGPAGDLVCVNPFPSRPLGFVGDTDGSRFHAAYFAKNPGIWTHGDLVTFTDDGMARMRGRSDGVVNVRGIRIGPAEIYKALDDFVEIRDALAVEQEDETDPAGMRLVLLLALHEGQIQTSDLVARIRRELVHQCTAAHVPDVVLVVAELPVTHSGKLAEAAAAAVVNNRPLADTAALRNPECLEAIRFHSALRGSTPLPVAGSIVAESLEQQLQNLWESLLGVSPIGQDDDFFELGGNSLTAARLTGAVKQLTGRDLSLASLFYAPTINRLARAVRELSESPASRLVRLKAGNQDRPLFLVHSWSGTVLELWAVARRLKQRRDVYGIQATGITLGQQPQTTVEDMAATYIDAMRQVQPNGPYTLGGYSLGGLIAFEMAQQLVSGGERVDLVILIDTTIEERYLPLAERLRAARVWVGQKLDVFRSPSVDQRGLRLRVRARHVTERLAMLFGYTPNYIKHDDRFPPHLQSVRDALRAAMSAYRPRPYSGRVLLIKASEQDPTASDATSYWRQITHGGWQMMICPGNHNSMIAEPNAADLARQLDSVEA